MREERREEGEDKTTNILSLYFSLSLSLSLFADGELILLHRLVPGPSTQSYGINVAEMANFPTIVVDMAKEKAKELEVFDGKRKR
jgi:DNA mismatch repair ATPase MutS